ncbi:PAS domain-containing protein [Polyangium aurulentum]|uniref:PAS domain-containing protein n=1 Tax=Polyangium aurulentum TaxID=2567896 RepID=UPI00146D2338|nr:PAS domain-containing protein [Polyangium aurulentum]UQA60946.1 PAS domain-containing protein [Polyangium aurulentum]
MTTPADGSLPTTCLALAFELSPAPMAIFTPEGALLSANPAWTALTGHAAADLQGDGWQTAVHEADRAAWAEALARTASEGARVEHELRLLDTRGGARAFRWTMARDAGTGAICIAGHDLEGERAVRRERIIRDVLDTSDINVWAMDADGTVTVHIGGGVRRIGLEPGQILGQNIFALYGDSPIITHIRMALAGERVHIPHDEVFGNVYESLTVPVRGPNGAVEGVAGVNVIITDLWNARRALEEQLLLVREQQRTIEQISTPIIEVWQGAVAMPLLGAFSGARAARAMEALLETIVDKQVSFAILDLTGVDTVDAETADALARIVQAVALLGAEALLVGLSPNVARTVVGLGLSLDKARTLRNLEEGLRYAMARR